MATTVKCGRDERLSDRDTHTLCLSEKGERRGKREIERRRVFILIISNGLIIIKN